MRRQSSARGIGSEHAVRKPLSSLSDAEVLRLVSECAYDGRAGVVDVLKFVGRAATVDDSARVSRLVSAVQTALDRRAASASASASNASGGDGKMALSSSGADAALATTAASALSSVIGLAPGAGGGAVAGGASGPVLAIGICTGAAGYLSRALNADRSATPVAFPFAGAAPAAPGQVTAVEMMKLRATLGLPLLPTRTEGGSDQPSRQFYIFGHPVGKSPSPATHNAGFRALGYGDAMRYDRFPATASAKDLERVRQAMQAPEFGGASVTVPLKLEIIPMLDELSEAARAIGAVNTVLRHPATGRLFGDNTDWQGIYNVIMSSLKSSGHPLLAHLGDGDESVDGRAKKRRRTQSADKETKDGGKKQKKKKKKNPLMLIIGAGGTARAAAYSAQRLGFRLCIWNRTQAKAEKLALEFGGTAVASLDSSEAKKELWPHVDVVVSTVPPEVNFKLPAESMEWRGAGAPLVVLDAAYRPRNTVLLQQVQAWGGIDLAGIDMLMEQVRRGSSSFYFVTWCLETRHVQAHTPARAPTNPHRPPPSLSSGRARKPRGSRWMLLAEATTQQMCRSERL